MYQKYIRSESPDPGSLVSDPKVVPVHKGVLLPLVPFHLFRCQFMGLFQSILQNMSVSLNMSAFMSLSGFPC